MIHDVVFFYISTCTWLHNFTKKLKYFLLKKDIDIQAINNNNNNSEYVTPQ
jgi:hypothetical protein